MKRNETNTNTMPAAALPAQLRSIAIEDIWTDAPECAAAVRDAQHAINAAADRIDALNGTACDPISAEFDRLGAWLHNCGDVRGCQAAWAIADQLRGSGLVDASVRAYRLLVSEATEADDPEWAAGMMPIADALGDALKKVGMQHAAGITDGRDGTVVPVELWFDTASREWRATFDRNGEGDEVSMSVDDDPQSLHWTEQLNYRSTYHATGLVKDMDGCVCRVIDIEQGPVPATTRDDADDADDDGDHPVAT